MYTHTYRLLNDLLDSCFVRCADDFEDSGDLFGIVAAAEEREAEEEFCHDAPDGPDVDRCAVGLGAHEDVGGTVPQRDDLQVQVRMDELLTLMMETDGNPQHEPRSSTYSWARQSRARVRNRPV